MSEHIGHIETHPRPEANLEKIAAERLKSIEHRGEQHTDRHEALASAREQLRRVEQAAMQTESTPKPAPTFKGVLTQAANYRHTMVSLRHRMKPAARAFSKVIHAPTVEAASEVIGKTILRPSVSLGATTTAVLLTGFLYLYARHYGFALSGSEIWVTLILGGLIGVLAEGIYTAIRRARTPIE